MNILVRLGWVERLSRLIAVYTRRLHVGLTSRQHEFSPFAFTYMKQRIDNNWC